MHHCNIMYPSCDTIYTGVMLNVTTSWKIREFFFISQSFSPFLIRRIFPLRQIDAVVRIIILLISSSERFRVASLNFENQ